MIKSKKTEADFKQKITFFSAAIIATTFLVRNTLRIRTYSKSYYQLLQNMVKSDVYVTELSYLQLPNRRNYVVLSSVFPDFPSNYFKNIEDPTKYRSNIGKFYEKLVFESGFQGTLIYSGKQHQIHFQMIKPSVGFQISQSSRYLQKKGLKFHKHQTIAVFGQLSYSNKMKKLIMKTELLGLDSVQLCKFWELRILATIFSTFYFSIVLGIAISINQNRAVISDEAVKKIKGYDNFQQASLLI